jgi:hypothetical protein
MNTSQIAVNVIRATCVIAILFVLASMGGAHPTTEYAWVLLFDVIKWPLDGAQGPFDSNFRVLSAVCGGLIISWSVMLLWLLNGPIKRGEPSAKRIFVIAVLSWYFLDSAGSLAAGWLENAMLNIPFMLGLVVPLYWVNGVRSNRSSAEVR